jgi:hypothetical protein
VLLFQTYNIILYVHAFLFCWQFSYRTCAFCKVRSDWLQLSLAALHINRHRVTSKIRLTMPMVKMSRADRNPWLAKMVIYINVKNRCNYSWTCLIWHSKGSGKLVRLYRLSKYSGFALVKRKTLGRWFFVGCHRMS